MDSRKGSRYHTQHMACIYMYVAVIQHTFSAIMTKVQTLGIATTACTDDVSIARLSPLN